MLGRRQGNQKNQKVSCEETMVFSSKRQKERSVHFSLWKKRLRVRICLSSGTSQKAEQKDVTIWLEGWRDMFTEAGKDSNDRYEDSRSDYPVKWFVCIKIFTSWIKKKIKKKEEISSCLILLKLDPDPLQSMESYTDFMWFGVKLWVCHWNITE